MNRIYTHYGAQSDHKRVLCVCSAGMLRSPTAALVLSQAPYNFNTRCAGTEDDYAIIGLTPMLVSWAEEIVCMEQHHATSILARFDPGTRPILTLHIPDFYDYRDPALMELIAKRYDRVNLDLRTPLLRGDL